jgi:hypothetical protein
MDANKFRSNVFHFGSILIIIFVILILVMGLWNHITIAKAIHASTKIAYCHDHCHVSNKLSELQSLSHQILDESGITFLTTIVVVLLVSIGIYFLKNAESKLKQIEKDTNELSTLQEKVDDKIKCLQEKDDVIEQASKTFLEETSRTLILHVPISFIYTLSSVLAEKRQQQGTLMSFFQKIARQIDNIEDSIKKETNVSLNRHIKESLIIYLFESIKNINKIIEINQLDNNWTVPNNIISDLNKILKSLSKE